jgi:hypothetical protein
VHYLSDEGSKVHSKKIKIGLESTLSKWWGLKDAFKRNRDRAIKGTIWDMRAQMCTQVK